MKLTFTKLDTYRKCPLRFRLRYREKLPEVSMGGRNLSLLTRSLPGPTENTGGSAPQGRITSGKP